MSLYIFRDWRKGLLVITFCAAGYIIADISGNILKHLFARLRPCTAVPNARLLVACYNNFSFPSGHASTSFAMASIICYFFRPAAVPALFIAAVIGFSRIYIGVHYPSDVIAGAVWGGVTGWLVIFIHKINYGQLNKKTLS